MNRHAILAGCALAALVTALPQPATATTSGGFSSSIYSSSTGTCVAVPGGTDDINTNLVMAACDNAADQEFGFEPVPGEPAGTYYIVNAASGICMSPFRLGVRQRNCFSDTGSLLLASAWDVIAVGGGEFTVHPANGSYGDPATGRYLAAHPAQSISLLLDFRAAGATGQQFVITGG